MAYIVNTSGESGYSRSDFEAAVAGKQDTLVSGVNIRTIGGQSVLGSGNLDFNQGGGEHEYTYDLTQQEISLHDDAINRINHVKSLGGSNDNIMVFGFISDLHQMLTREQALADETISQAVKEVWPDNDTPAGGGSNGYYGNTAEGSVKLMGAICNHIDADAVFCGGDMSSGRLPFEAYDVMLDKTVDMFDKYISVPHFTVEGNHDRRYNNAVRCRTNAEWLAYLKRFNTSGLATYLADDDPNYGYGKYGYVANTYFVDFPSRKVRVVMRSQYEKIERDGEVSAYGTGPFWMNVYKSFQFDNPSDAETWTMVSVSHYTTTNIQGYYFSRYLSALELPSGASTDYKKRDPLNGTHHGYASVGELYGHVHNSWDDISNGELNSIAINTATAHAATGSYLFSMFVLNTTTFKLYEIKVGTQGNTSSTAYRTNSNVSEYGWFEYDIRHYTPTT